MSPSPPALRVERAPAGEPEHFGVREVLDALPDGAYITDASRKILYWSRAAERISGWPPEEVVGHCCTENFLAHVDKEGHALCGQEQCPLHRAILTGRESRRPLLVFARHREGHRLPVEVSVAPLRDPAGRIVGGVQIFRDCSRVIQELHQARAIQQHALESSLPADERVVFRVRYEPEDLVGGDFYRIQALDADRYAVLVADVMGHGLSSALYTMQLRSLWEECRPELASPARFLAELNRRLFKLASPDANFATAVMLVLNAASGQVDYVRAGHPAPLWFRAGAEPVFLAAKAPAVGLIEDAAYQETCVQLRPADRLLLYTDGAAEITNPQGEMLAELGLKRLLMEMNDDALDLARIEMKLFEYNASRRFPDDLTLLTLGFNGPSPAGRP